MAVFSSVTRFSYSTNSLEVVIALSVSILVTGIVASFGALFLPLINRYNESRSKTALVISLLRGLTFGCGVLSAFLTEKFGVGKIAVVGALLVSSGFIAAYFATTILHLYFTVGICCGFGNSLLLFTVTTIMTRLVKKKNAPVALALLTMAPSTAGLFLPYLLDYLEQTYSLPGTFLILGGISLNSLSFAVLTPAFITYDDKKAKGTDEIQDATEPDHSAGVENVAVGGRLRLKCFISFIMITYFTGTTLASFLMGAFNGLWQDLFLEKELSESESFICFICYTVMDTAARALPMFTKRFEALALFSVPLFCSIVGSTGQLLLHMFTTFVPLAVGSSLSGFCVGGIMTASSLVIYDILGFDGTPAGFGFFFTLTGVSVSLSGTIFGAMVDATSSYKAVTMTIAGILFVSSIMFLICLLSWSKGKKLFF